MTKVVVDASLALRWVLKDEKEDKVDSLIYGWAVSLTDMIAPPLFLAEVTNALYLACRRLRLNAKEVKLALQTILDLGVRISVPSELYTRSMDLAINYTLTNAYDAQYLALAELESCELWTADERLARAVRPLPDWLKII
jgi:predicted nucleic acid-binding protein